MRTLSLGGLSGGFGPSWYNGPNPDSNLYPNTYFVSAEEKSYLCVFLRQVRSRLPLQVREVIFEVILVARFLFFTLTQWPNGHGMRLTGGFYFAVLYIFYEYCPKPVWLDAVNLCLSEASSGDSLCSAMWVTYPSFPPSLAELSEFRTKLLDPAVYTWVKLGSDEWFRLTEIGIVYRNPLNGTAFEARREPGGPAGTGHEYFHMCRHYPCSFSGGTE